jgi:hypothetical protein
MSVVVIGAAVFWIPRMFKPDFKTELAKQLNVEKSMLYLNLPPSRGRLPGFTFVAQPTLLPIGYPDRSDPDIKQGQEFSLDWSLADSSTASGTKGAGPLGALFSNTQGINTELRVRGGRVIEMTLLDLKRRLLASSDVLDQAARGNKPMVIVRAFEGELELRLTKSGAVSGDVWLGKKKLAEAVKAPSGQQEVEVHDNGSNQTTISWKDPVVFAYEVMRAEIITKSMGVQPDDISFSRVPAAELDKLTNLPEAHPSQSRLSPTRERDGSPGVTVYSCSYPEVVGASASTEGRLLSLTAAPSVKHSSTRLVGLTIQAATSESHKGRPDINVSPLSSVTPPDKGEPWALVTISAGFYPQVQWLQQEWNALDADVFEKALSVYRPRMQMRLRATRDQPSSSEGILEFLRSSASQAGERGAKLLVIYYIGHAVTRANGDILLLQGSITAKMLAELEKSSANSELPKSIAGLAALSDSINLSEGFVRLADIHARLKESGIPFVLLVDGCMENNAFQSFVKSLGFTYRKDQPMLYYSGSAPVIFHEMLDLADRMRHFPDRLPYLKDTNPVIMAAKPGTVAPMKKNPEWSGGFPVGPLTEEAYRASVRAQLAAEPLSLPEFLESLAGFRGVGEINLDGAICWSDFSQVESAARGIRLRPSSAAEPNYATLAIRRLFSPSLGKIHEFVFDEVHQNFFIAAGDSSLWRWKEGQKPVLLKDDVHFLSLACTSSGDVYMYNANEHEILIVEPSGNLKPIKQGCDVAVMGPGFESKSVIIAEGPSAVGGVEALSRLQSNRFAEIDRMETAFLTDLAEWSAGSLCYTQEDRSAIYARQNGKTHELCRGLGSPNLLATAAPDLYCLNAKGEIIYRLQSNGTVSRTDLLSLEPNLKIDRTPYTRGFRARPGGTLLLANGDSIIEMDPAQLKWEITPLTF